MPTYSIGGVTGPPGSATEVGAPDLGALPAVSASTPASLTPDIDSGGWEHAWWKITPAEAGARMVDASLSYDAAGAPLPSYADIYTFDGSSYDFYDGVSNFGPVTFAAGVDYFISVGRMFGDGDGSSFMVLRVGAVAVPGDWVQPADQEWWKGGDFQGESLPPYATPITWPSVDTLTSFHGVHSNLQPFAGPPPGLDAAAVDCSWGKARQGDYATTFWTSDGTGTGDPGAPTCISQDPGNVAGDGGVGVIYESTTGSIGIPAAEGFEVRSATVRFWLTPALTALGPTGGALPPDPPPGGDVEYEAALSELLGVDAAPDETTHETTDITVQWVGTSTPQPENPGDTWGPKLETTQFIGEAGGPEGLTGDYTLPDFPATGAALSWTPIPDPTVAAALASEASYDPLLAYAGGLRWVGLFPEQKTSSPPPLATPTLTIPEAYTDVRWNQIVAVRLRVRPSRYRLIPPAKLPEVDSGAVQRIFPRGDELGSNPSPRNYPPQKSSTRIYSQEP